MLTTNISDLRKNIKRKFDAVSDDKETMLVHRAGQEDLIVITLSEFNSWKETLYLMSTKANRENLEASITEADKGELTAIKTEDLWK